MRVSQRRPVSDFQTSATSRLRQVLSTTETRPQQVCIMFFGDAPKHSRTKLTSSVLKSPPPRGNVFNQPIFVRTPQVIQHLLEETSAPRPQGDNLRNLTQVLKTIVEQIQELAQIRVNQAAPPPPERAEYEWSESTQAWD